MAVDRCPCCAASAASASDLPATSASIAGCSASISVRSPGCAPPYCFIFSRPCCRAAGSASPSASCCAAAVKHSPSARRWSRPSPSPVVHPSPQADPVRHLTAACYPHIHAGSTRTPQRSSRCRHRPPGHPVHSARFRWRSGEQAVNESRHRRVIRGLGRLCCCLSGGNNRLRGAILTAGTQPLTSTGAQLPPRTAVSTSWR